jgi:hypothetical protein
VPGGWDKVCNELLNLYLSHYIIIMIKSWRMRWVGHVAWERSVCKALVIKPRGKRPLRRSRCRWENTIFNGS